MQRRRIIAEQDDHGWKKVKRGNETKARSETRIMKKEVSFGWRNQVRRAQRDDAHFVSKDCPVLQADVQIG